MATLADSATLHDAAKAGNCDRIAELIAAGHPVDSRDASQWTPLIDASYAGQKEVVLLLLEHKADVNATNDIGFSAVTRASRQGHLEIVKILCAHGADIARKAAAGNSAMHYAAMSDHLPICEFLLSQGADLMATNDLQETALGNYGLGVVPPLSVETKAMRCAALGAAWAEGPHPSQVQRRLLGKGPYK